MKRFLNGLLGRTPADPTSRHRSSSRGRLSVQTLEERLVFNVAPVAVNDYYEASESEFGVGSGVSNGVLANDTDADGDTLSAELVVAAANGYTVWNSNGSFHFFPLNADYYGTETFAYRAKDGAGVSNLAFVTLRIWPMEDRPVAADDAYTVAEDGTLSVAAAGVLANDSDVDGDRLNAVLVAGAAHGVLDLKADGSFTYAPEANYYGLDSFTYRANDGHYNPDFANSNVVTVTLTVTPVADAELAVADSFTTAEDTPRSGNVLSNDGIGWPLTASLQNAPAHGSVALNPNGTFTYTPASNFHGTDSFTYRASPVGTGGGASSVATVTLTVTPVNDAPVAVADAASVSEGSVVTIPVLANDNDIEGNPLTALLVSGPAHGTLVLNTNGSFRYAHNGSETTSDSFTYRVNDGALNSNVVTVSIAVMPVNDAPVAVDNAYTRLEDTPMIVLAAQGLLANDNDVDGDTLNAVLVAAPAHGSLTPSADGSFQYIPDANFHGMDSFTYKVNDGVLDSNVATVTLTITSVNDKPTVGADAYTLAEDVVLNVATTSGLLVNDSDADGDTLSAVLVAGPSHGVLELNVNGSFTYTPAADYYGPDSFTYKVNDGAIDSNVATVVLTVTPVADAGLASADSFTTAEDTSRSGNVLTNDGAGEPLTAALVTGPSHGSVTLNANGSFTYTPAANYHGPDSFTYQAHDGTTLSNVATVSLSVTPVNDTPALPGSTSITVSEDTPLLFQLPAGTDVDGDAVRHEIFFPPVLATLFQVQADNVTPGAPIVYTGAPVLVTNPNGYVYYVPPPNQSGNPRDPIVFGGIDSSGARTTFVQGFSYVNFLITPVNDAPVAKPKSHGGVNNVLGINLWPDIVDIEGDAITVHFTELPQRGTLYAGPFGGGGAPVAIGQAYTHGGGDEASFHFISDALYEFGTPYAKFSYYATDAAGAASATVTDAINISFVSSPPSPPTPTGPNSYTTPENTSVSIELSATDPDGQFPFFTIKSLPAHGKLFYFVPELRQEFELSGDMLPLELNASNDPIVRLRYAPDTGYHGSDSIRYGLRDQRDYTPDEFTIDLTVGTVVIPPLTVTDVRARWGGQSASILNGGVLPWQIEAIEVVFSENVEVDLADLRLSGVLGGNYQLGGFTYNTATRTAAWSLLSPAAVDRLMIQLDGDNAAGDGNTGVRTSSGNYLANGDYSLAVSMLQGDFDGDGVVTSTDQVGIRNRQPSYGGVYDKRADMDGDGDVDNNDLLVARRCINSRLPQQPSF